MVSARVACSVSLCLSPAVPLSLTWSCVCVCSAKCPFERDTSRKDLRFAAAKRCPTRPQPIGLRVIRIVMIDDVLVTR